jgi:hypothetical protein
LNSSLLYVCIRECLERVDFCLLVIPDIENADFQIQANGSTHSRLFLQSDQRDCASGTISGGGRVKAAAINTGATSGSLQIEL